MASTPQARGDWCSTQGSERDQTDHSTPRAVSLDGGALIWALALHELLVVKLAEQVGLPDTERPLTARDVGAELFARLKAELGPELLNAQGRIRFMPLREKLAVLRARLHWGSRT